MQFTTNEPAWSPSDEASEAAKSALQSTAKTPAIKKTFESLAKRRASIESAITTITNKPGDVDCCAHRAVVDAAARFEADPSPETIREAFSAHVDFLHQREHLDTFSAHFLRDIRDRLRGDFEAACQAVIDGARQSLEDAHQARVAAVESAATSAKICLGSEIRAAGAIHAEAMRAVGDSYHPHDAAGFAHGLGLPI